MIGQCSVDSIWRENCGTLYGESRKGVFATYKKKLKSMLGIRVKQLLSMLVQRILRYNVKAGVNVKAVFTSLNTAFLPISRSRFKRRQIPMLITLSTIWQFCVNFWVIFRCFGKERFFLKG